MAPCEYSLYSAYWFSLATTDNKAPPDGTGAAHRRSFYCIDGFKSPSSGLLSPETATSHQLEIPTLDEPCTCFSGLKVSGSTTEGVFTCNTFIFIFFVICCGLAGRRMTRREERRRNSQWPGRPIADLNTVRSAYEYGERMYHRVCVPHGDRIQADRTW